MVDLKSIRVRVYLEQPGDVDELLEVDIATDNRDRVQWDAVRSRKGWPTSGDAPSMWMTFLAWHAAKRSGGPVPDTFEAFNKICVAIEPIDQDGNALTKEDIIAGAPAEDGDGFPTSRDPDTDSSLS